MVTTETMHTSHTNHKESPRGLKIIAEASQIQDQLTIQARISDGTDSPVKHEDLWTCRHCGWTYPNAHPSAKHRRSHKKNCGKRKAAKDHSKSPSNHSNDSSSDEESHVGSEHNNYEHVVRTLNYTPSDQDSHPISQGMWHMEGDMKEGIQALAVEYSLKVLNDSLPVQPQDHIEPAKPIEETIHTAGVVDTKAICQRTIIEEPMLPPGSDIPTNPDSDFGQDFKSETGDESLPSILTTQEYHDGVTEELTSTETTEQARTCDPVEISSICAITDSPEDPATKQQTGSKHHGAEDSWTCRFCGWVYPNHHPSAKHRRNHKKHCPKLRGLDRNTAAHEHAAGSSDEASSDDESHLQELSGNGLKEPVQEGIKGIIPSTVTTAAIIDDIGCNSPGEDLTKKNKRGADSEEGFEYKIDETINHDLPMREPQLLEKTSAETTVENFNAGPKEDSYAKAEEHFHTANPASGDPGNTEAMPFAVHPSQTSENSLLESGHLNMLHKDKVDGNLSKDADEQSSLIESSQPMPFEEGQAPQLWEQLLDAELGKIKPKELGDMALQEVLPANVKDIQESEPDVSRPKPEAIKTEDTWTCRRCGWTYPNPHPSAKHRRNHKKHCGKVKGFEVDAAVEHTHGSSDDASSDDEFHPKQVKTLPNVQQDGSHVVQPMLPTTAFSVKSGGENSCSESIGDTDNINGLNMSGTQSTEVSSKIQTSDPKLLVQAQNTDKPLDTGTASLQNSNLAVPKSSQTPEKSDFSPDAKSEEPKQLSSAYVSPTDAETSLGMDQFDDNDKRRPSLQVLFFEDVKVDQNQTEQVGIAPSTDHSSPSSKGTAFVKRVLSKVLSAPPDISVPIEKEKPKTKPKWGVFACCSSVN